MTFQQLNAFYNEAALETKRGKVASYIPALEKENPNHFSLAIVNGQQEPITFGDQTKKFSMQSVVKVINFLVVCNQIGLQKILEYVDVEPTGDSFNSIIRLESSAPGKPYNPMINAGAITIASLLQGHTAHERVQSVQVFLGNIIGEIPAVNEEVFQSEYDNADHNRAIAYFLKGKNFLQGDVEIALQTYFRLCSLEITAYQLAEVGLFLASNGRSHESQIDESLFHVTKALMVTCGMYNASGKFSAFIGIPAKSGVSGAIVACVKNSDIEHLTGPIGIGLFGPAIDYIGNSVAGIHFLTNISKTYRLHSL